MSIKKQMALMDRLMVDCLKASLTEPDFDLVDLDYLFKAQKHLYETACLAPYVEAAERYDRGDEWKRGEN